MTETLEAKTQDQMEAIEDLETFVKVRRKFGWAVSLFGAAVVLASAIGHAKSNKNYDDILSYGSVLGAVSIIYGAGRIADAGNLDRIFKRLPGYEPKGGE